MKLVEIKEVVSIPGAFGGVGGNMLHVDVKLTFDIPPALFSPGMTLIVMSELHRSIDRLLEQAKKEKI